MMYLHRNVIVESALARKELGLCKCGGKGMSIEYDAGIRSVCRCQNCYNTRKLQLAMEGNVLSQVPHSRIPFGMFSLAGANVHSIARGGKALYVSIETATWKLTFKGHVSHRIVGSSVVSVERCDSVPEEYDLTLLMLSNGICKIKSCRPSYDTFHECGKRIS